MAERRPEVRTIGAKPLAKTGLRDGRTPVVDGLDSRVIDIDANALMSAARNPRHHAGTELPQPNDGHSPRHSLTSRSHDAELIASSSIGVTSIRAGMAKKQLPSKLVTDSTRSSSRLVI